MSQSSSIQTRKSSRINRSRSRSNKKKSRKGGHSQPRLLLEDALKDIENKEKWSDARISAYNNRFTHKNEFWYRFNAKWNEEKQDFDFEATQKGRWCIEEHKLFMQRIKEFGVNHQWGIFSTVIPGRCGYICSNYWKRLIKQGAVNDISYFWDDQEKKYRQYRKMKKISRYAFEVNKDPSGVWRTLPAKHPKYPNLKRIERTRKEILNDEQPKSPRRSKRASNQETTNTTNTNSKCDEIEDETGDGTEDDVTCSESETEPEIEEDIESESEEIEILNSDNNGSGLRRSPRKLSRRKLNYQDPITDIEEEEDEEDEDDEEDEEDNDSVANTNSQLIVSKSIHHYHNSAISQKHAASDGDDENSSDLSTIKPSKIRHKKRNRIISDDEEEKEEEENNDNDKELDDIDIESEQQTLLSLQYEEEQEGIVSVTVDNESVLNGGHDLGETQRDDEIAMDVDDIASSHHDHMNSNNEEEIDGDCDNNRDISIDTVTVNDNNNNQREIGRKRRREEVDDDNNNGDGLNEDRISKKRKTNDNMEILYKLQEIIENDTRQKERIKELEDVKMSNMGQIEEMRKALDVIRKKMEENDKIKNERIICLENELKESVKREKENDLELEKFENIKHDLKEGLNAYQFALKYPEIYE